jgi:lipopolysaccharide export system permease protein
VFSFVAILISTRLHDIAQFASYGAGGYTLLWFVLYQVPLVVPIAMPISGLIAALILVQKLSTHQELTAMRASGLSLGQIAAPILIGAAFLSVINFVIVSEYTTQSHLSTRMLEYKLKDVNPLLLLNNTRLSQLKGVYVHSMSSAKIGDNAKDLAMAFWSKQNERINLMIAKDLSASHATLNGSDVTFISGLSGDKEDDFDNLYVENMEKLITPVSDLYLVLQKATWKVHPDYLQMNHLLLHTKKESELLQQMLVMDNVDKTILSQQKSRVARNYTEYVRRFSLGFSVFALSLLGISYGVSIGRQARSRGIYYVIGFASLYLVSYFSAKGYDDRIATASTFYLLPLFVIICVSVYHLKRLSKGLE